MIKHKILIVLTPEIQKSLDLIMFLTAADSEDPGPKVIKLFDMLNSSEHEIYPAHKC